LVVSVFTKGKIVPVRFNDEELKAMTKCADKSEHRTPSAWIRHTLKNVNLPVIITVAASF
jgi:hypothetical protein